MIHLVLALLTYACFVLQLSSARHLVIAGVEPNFLMAVMIVALARVRGWKLIVWAAIVGFGCDLLSSDRIGLWMGAFTLLAFCFEQTVGQAQWGRTVMMVFASAAVLGACCVLQLAEDLLAGGAFDVADLQSQAACIAYSAGIAWFVLLCIGSFSRTRSAVRRRVA